MSHKIKEIIVHPRGEVIVSSPSGEDEHSPVDRCGWDYLSYDRYMNHVYFGNTLPEKRSALKVEVTDETSNWLTILALASGSKLNTQMIGWSLFPLDSKVALTALRTSIVIVLTNHLDILKQNAHSSGVDTCIDKGD